MVGCTFFSTFAAVFLQIEIKALNTIIAIIALLIALAPESINSVVLEEVSIVAPIKMPDSDEKGAYSATTISRTELENNHINSIKELTAQAPNFYQPDYGSRMTSSIYVRGFGSRIDQPVVGMNIDERPVMNKNGYDFELFDIDKIQILRGAQSALYGRNTSGGAINIQTLSPLMFQGKRLSLEYGNENHIRIKASHYAAPTDEFGWSASVLYSHSDGYFMNYGRNEKCDGGNNIAMRLRTQWLPSHNWSIDNTFTTGYTDEGGWAYRNYNNGILAPVNYNDPCSYRRFNIDNGLIIKRYFNTFTLSSTTGYQFMDDGMRIDNDFLPFDYFSMGQFQQEHSLTQEFVARSKEKQSFTWQTGLFSFIRHNNMSAPVTFKKYGIDNLILKNANNSYYLPIYGSELEFRDNQFTIEDHFRIPSFGAAAYLLMGYNLSGFNFSAGLRLDYEKSVMDYNCYTQVYSKLKKNTGYTPLNVEFTGSNSIDAIELLPSFSVSYSKDWGTIYASARRGFKAGGFNTQLFSDILKDKMAQELIGNPVHTDALSTIYKPETNWTYELGTHLSPLASGALKISATAFYIDCSNQQLTVFPPGLSTGRMMSNAGESFSYGVETTAAYRTGPFTLNAGYGYTHAEFKKYKSGSNDYSGNILPYAPQETMSANVEYRLPVSEKIANIMMLNIGWTGIGRIYWNEENTLLQEKYGLLSASLTWEKGIIGASFWGKNLLNKQYNTFYFRSMQNDFFAQGKPLQLGISININL